MYYTHDSFAVKTVLGLERFSVWAFSIGEKSLEGFLQNSSVDARDPRTEKLDRADFFIIFSMSG